MDDQKTSEESTGAGAGLVLANFIPYRIVLLGHIISRALSRVYENEKLTIPEWRVLAVVSQAESTAARDVARLTPMDKMAVSRAVASLESKGLVIRKPDARDRRVFSLSLSAEGAALFRRIAGLATAFERSLLDSFDEKEQKMLRSFLERLESNARK